MDTSTRPGQDFYKYVNGTYLKHLTIPPDWSLWDNYIADLVTAQNQERDIIETEVRSNPPIATEGGKIRALYRSFMRVDVVERRGLGSLLPNLSSIRAAATPNDLVRLMGQANGGFYGSLFDIYVDRDERDPDRYAVHLEAGGGLGLPGRDYYLDPFESKRRALTRYVGRLLYMAGGRSDNAAAAASVVGFETRLAQASMTATQSRNASSEYDQATVTELAGILPEFDWVKLLSPCGMKATDHIVLRGRDSIIATARIFLATPMDTLRAWQTYRLLDAAADYLPANFADSHFDFPSREIDGVPQPKARWKKAVDFVDLAMGDAIGKRYVTREFPPSYKARIEGYVRRLRDAFRRRIQTVRWMQEPTKQQALLKLDRLVFNIGYPDHFKSYDELAVDPDDLMLNAIRVRAFDWSRQVNRLHSPVDRSEWQLLPQEPNGRYESSTNSVEFSAAFLQPPFFNLKADDAVNFGAVVAQTGHEMTHAFDDNGRKRDAAGRLRDWWTPADTKRFQELADRLAAQYDAYEVLPGAHIDGKFTMGENIADQGGLSLALDAYHASLNGHPAPVIDGLTGDQRLFLSWGQMFRGKMRDDAQRRHLTMDPHSPERFRVDGVVRNLDDWYAAFRVLPGDALYLALDKRVLIW